MEDEIMYSEIYGFLNLIGNEYINKLPKKLLEFLKISAKHKIHFDLNKDINEQLSEKAIAFIAYLNLQYWCNSEEKQRLIAIYQQNDSIEEKIKSEKYSYENLFNNSQKEIKENTNSMELMEIKKENIFVKFINLITKIFKKQK